MPAPNRSTRDALGGEQVEGRRAVLELLRAGRSFPLAVQREGRETSVEVDVMDIGRRG